MRRPGYTLLEVVLAMAIASALLIALYIAVDVQLRHMQAGRDLVEQSNLARGILSRYFEVDISQNLGPLDPSKLQSSGGQSGAPGGGAGGQAGAAGAAGAQGQGQGQAQGQGGQAGGSGQQGGQSGQSNTVIFNLGVQGDSSRLVLYVTRVPRELYGSDAPPVVSDLRRITYWLAGGEGAPLGLARQEVKVATSDDALNSMPPDIPDEASYVVAEEVRSLSFSYFDGSAWQDSWDGTAAGSDGQTPQGPPVLIAIVIGVAVPGKGKGGEPVIKQYRHVVAVQAANGAAAQQQQQAGGASP